jgi:hypothetical protein
LVWWQPCLLLRHWSTLIIRAAVQSAILTAAVTAPSRIITGRSRLLGVAVAMNRELLLLLIEPLLLLLLEFAQLSHVLLLLGLLLQQPELLLLSLFREVLQLLLLGGKLGPALYSDQEKMYLFY